MRNFIAAVMTITGCGGWLHTLYKWEDFSEDEIIARFFTAVCFILVAVAIVVETK